MNCSRASVLHSSYPNKKDFTLALLLTPAFYMANCVVTLRDPKDVAASESADRAMSEWACLVNNMGYWFAGYLIGLNYTHAN
mmetsp:Transcript_3796/g.4769  ORF Transcript_3796/g.4769 Transcript_3796/m.4769 type:complete len:82 (+) Transcript_3796:321-566(+)|eukprot:CAMPEP_0170470354 /NCGR_PEP_ID=MMETSP0123-20130129/12834_1 /TAXON_ID=182087 /ORGANISM="Favella ehrenbergii, Strain Fehren 1" /LENGTH=81 /DNA_ID=CAMNT_0010737439 /DNA_START=241 /DNA_END=486 /DNA_ORIENTATION=-